jgi:hypothetical protein
MIYTSLALVMLAAIPPFGNTVHMHPLAKDGRVELTVVNHANQFRDVKVEGRSYEIPFGHSITIKAPVGTVVYRNSYAPSHKRGEVLVSLTPELNKTTMNID